VQRRQETPLARITSAISNVLVWRADQNTLMHKTDLDDGFEDRVDIAQLPVAAGQERHKIVGHMDSNDAPAEIDPLAEEE